MRRCVGYTLRMAQDPWKRAYQLQRLKQTGAPAGPPPSAPRLRQPRPWLTVLLLLLLMLALGAGGYFAWLSRERWLPQAREELPAPVQEAVPVYRRGVDQGALEDGLGIRLAVFGNVHDMLAATRDWNIEWKLSSLGSDRARVSAPGVWARANANVIEYYELDITGVYASLCWKKWLPELQRAGLSPELSWEMLTGEKNGEGNQEYELRSADSLKRPEGTVRQAFVLRFVDGYLRRVEGQVSFGPAIPPGPVQREDVPLEHPAPQPPPAEKPLPPNLRPTH
jgi:hypothetical protein